MAQNSFMRNLMDTKGNITADNVFDQTSRTFEQNQSLNYSDHPRNQEPKFTSCNFMDIVTRMKNFKLNSGKQVREYFIRKGMRLFYELNENLNAYKQGFDK